MDIKQLLSDDGVQDSRSSKDSSHCPELPNDVLQQIYTYALVPILGDWDDEDFVGIWLGAHQLSRAWRSNIAQVYLDILVRDPVVDENEYASDEWDVHFNRMYKKRRVFDWTSKSEELDEDPGWPEDVW